MQENCGENKFKNGISMKLIIQRNFSFLADNQHFQANVNKWPTAHIKIENNDHNCYES